MRGVILTAALALAAVATATATTAAFTSEFTPSELWAGRKRHPAVVHSIVDRPSTDVLSLNGEWDFRAEPHDAPAHGLDKRVGRLKPERRIQVPGAWDVQGVGKEGLGDYHLAPDRAPKQLRNVHSGEGLYWRTVEIPAGWKGRRIWLKVGGVNCRGYFYVNDRAVAMQQVYCGAWKYDVTDCVEPGRTALVSALIDNAVGSRNAQPGNAHRWGGFTRGIELEATPSDCWIDDAWVRGDFDGRQAIVNVEVGRGEKGERGETLRVTVDGTTVNQPIRQSDDQIISIPLADFRPWSPEHPNLYTAKVELVSADGKALQTRYERFGVRKLEVRGKDFYLNDRPFYIRGFGDDSTYPITGCSPCDHDYHYANLRKAKEAGFNYVRLHTHCEMPEYMEACDELGILVQPELSYYFDFPMDHFDYDPLKDARDRWITYRRYPSWATASSGNEGQLGPNASAVMYAAIKAADPDRLVQDEDGPSSADEKGRKTEDFVTGPVMPWRYGLIDTPVPFVAHEYLNLSVKQDSRLEQRFSGAWKPLATREKRRSELAAAGLSLDWGDRLQDSQHALQAYFQKQGVEQARRDPFCRGYIYWTIVDVGVENTRFGFFTAQGFLDCFWNPKPAGLTPRDFAVFNSPDCLLMDYVDRVPPPEAERLKAYWWGFKGSVRYETNDVFTVGEKITPTFSLARYGESPLEDETLEWRLVAGGKALAAGTIAVGKQSAGHIRRIGAAEIVVPELAHPAEARLEAKLGRLSNSWRLWLFPKATVAAARARAKAAGIVIADEGSDEAKKALKDGRNLVTVSGQTGGLNYALGWWWIGKQVGTAVKRHPVLGDFPTDDYLSPLYFPIIREGLKLPVYNLKESDLVIVGEGADAFYAYLAVSVQPNGAKHVRVAGLDVTNETPSGASLLNNVVNYLEQGLMQANRDEARGKTR